MKAQPNKSKSRAIIDAILFAIAATIITALAFIATIAVIILMPILLPLALLSAFDEPRSRCLRR